MATNNINPGDLFGGTWKQYARGRTIIGQYDDDTDFATVGNYGGEKRHTLSYNEMPSHTHTALGYLCSNEATGYGLSQGNVGFANRVLVADGGSNETSNAGSNWSHNNLPPYIVAYIWERIE